MFWDVGGRGAVEARSSGVFRGRSALAVLLLFWLGCGTEESGSSLPVVSAPGPDGADAAQVGHCLDLVGAQQFEQALPICRDAQRSSPRDETLRAALEITEAHLRELP